MRSRATALGAAERASERRTVMLAAVGVMLEELGEPWVLSLLEESVEAPVASVRAVGSVASSSAMLAMGGTDGGGRPFLIQARRVRQTVGGWVCHLTWLR